MPIVTEILQLADEACSVLTVPPVAAAFIPPPGASGKEGEFCALRLADDSVGTAFVLLGDTLARLQLRSVADLVGRSPADLARGFASSDPVERSLGLAAVNAITQHVYRRAGYEPDLAANSLGSLALEKGDRLGMVGFFTPLIERVRTLGVPLTVVELRADLVQEGPDFIVTLDPGRLAECNKIVCTSTVLLNDTLEDVLRHGSHAEAFAIIGPSAGCFPDPLFTRGVTTVGGHWVSDGGLLMRRAAAQEAWGDAAKKSCITRSDYPGTRALIARAGAR